MLGAGFTASKFSKSLGFEMMNLQRWTCKPENSNLGNLQIQTKKFTPFVLTGKSENHKLATFTNFSNLISFDSKSFAFFSFNRFLSLKVLNDSLWIDAYRTSSGSFAKMMPKVLVVSFKLKLSTDCQSFVLPQRPLDQRQRAQSTFPNHLQIRSLNSKFSSLSTKMPLNELMSFLINGVRMN